MDFAIQYSMARRISFVVQLSAQIVADPDGQSPEVLAAGGARG
ncbi:hypothetical protein [Janibacter limosus]|nr:hypothetical protein [Janibacter limosus]